MLLLLRQRCTYYVDSVTTIAAVAVLQWHWGQRCSSSVCAADSQRTDSACAERAVYVQNALVWQLRTHKQQNNVHREGRRVWVNTLRSYICKDACAYTYNSNKKEIHTVCSVQCAKWCAIACVKHYNCSTNKPHCDLRHDQQL
jgi:hypothetical protein